jgi:hypothetical protein
LIGNSIRPLGLSALGGRWRQTQITVWSGPLLLWKDGGDEGEELGGGEGGPLDGGGAVGIEPPEGVVAGAVALAPGDVGVAVAVAVVPLVGVPDAAVGVELGDDVGLLVGVFVGGWCGFSHFSSPCSSFHPASRYGLYPASVSSTS